MRVFSVSPYPPSPYLPFPFSLPSSPLTLPASFVSSPYPFHFALVMTSDDEKKSVTDVPLTDKPSKPNKPPWAARPPRNSARPT